jgi:hypothetical protein
MRTINFPQRVALEFPASPASEASASTPAPPETQRPRNEEPEREDSEEPEEGRRRRNPAPIRKSHSASRPDILQNLVRRTGRDSFVYKMPQLIDTEDVDMLLNTSSGLPFRRFRR